MEMASHILSPFELGMREFASRDKPTNLNRFATVNPKLLRIDETISDAKDHINSKNMVGDLDHKVA